MLEQLRCLLPHHSEFLLASIDAFKEEGISLKGSSLKGSVSP